MFPLRIVDIVTLILIDSPGQSCSWLVSKGQNRRSAHRQNSGRQMMPRPENRDLDVSQHGTGAGRE